MTLCAVSARPAARRAAGAAFAAGPAGVLWAGEAPPAALPVCDHYAGREKFLLKALELQAGSAASGRPSFDITADCEDGAPVGAEASHAAMIARVLASPANRFGRVGLRIHDLAGAHWQRDLETVLPATRGRLAYVVLPKLRAAAEIDLAIEAIDTFAPGDALPLHVLIETHGALREVEAIAAHPRVECLSFGLMDFVSAHHGAIPAAALASPGQFEHPLVARAKLAIAAAAHGHGKVASHNVTTALGRPEQAAADAQRAAAEFGYTRMWSIHPDQIAPIVAALTPAHDEVERAARVIAAARAADWGPIAEPRTAGDQTSAADPAHQLHDRASYRLFWSQLARARAAGQALPAAVQDLFLEEDTP